MTPERRRDHRMWILLAAILLSGICLLWNSASAAARLPKQWEVNANIESFINPDESIALRQPIAVEPILSEILTPAAWDPQDLLVAVPTVSTLIPQDAFELTATARPALPTTPASTPTPRPTQPPSPTATTANTPIPSPTESPTALPPTATFTATPVPPSATPTATSTSTLTQVPIPTATDTPEPTDVPLPTRTDTPEPEPTDQPPPPTVPPPPTSTPLPPPTKVPPGKPPTPTPIK